MKNTIRLMSVFMCLFMEASACRADLFHYKPTRGEQGNFTTEALCERSTLQHTTFTGHPQRSIWRFRTVVPMALQRESRAAKLYDWADARLPEQADIADYAIFVLAPKDEAYLVTALQKDVWNLAQDITYRSWVTTLLIAFPFFLEFREAMHRYYTDLRFVIRFFPQAWALVKMHTEVLVIGHWEKPTLFDRWHLLRMYLHMVISPLGVIAKKVQAFNPQQPLPSFLVQPIREKVIAIQERYNRYAYNHGWAIAIIRRFA